MHVFRRLGRYLSWCQGYELINFKCTTDYRISELCAIDARDGCLDLWSIDQTLTSHLETVELPPRSLAA